jgi:hypothetical protein
MVALLRLIACLSMAALEPARAPATTEAPPPGASDRRSPAPLEASPTVDIAPGSAPATGTGHEEAAVPWQDGDKTGVPGPNGPPLDTAALEQAVAALPSRPTVEEVQHAALGRANATERTSRGWMRRARAAAALPAVTAQLDLRADQSWNFDQEAGAADALTEDAGSLTGVRLRTTWELDRLVFNLDELRAARAGLDMLDWRERLLVRVTQLYFERQRLLLEDALVGAGEDVAKTVARRIRLREVEAVLRGLTGLDMPRPTREPRR